MIQVKMPCLKRPVDRTFVSERLVFRSIEASDAEKFYEMISGPGCMELGLSKIPRPTNRKQVDELVTKIQRQALLFVFICLCDSSEDGHPIAGTPIGSMNLSLPSPDAKEGHRSTSLGILLVAAYRNKGYGAESVTWVMNWAFNYSGVHRFELRSYSYNEAAIRLWEKLGFKLEGAKRENVWFQRTWFDTLIYSILEGEWEALQERRGDDRRRVGLQ